MMLKNDEIFNFSESDFGSVISDVDNPWLTLGIMNGIADQDLLREWGGLLDIQTRILGPQEVAWLRAKGFGENCIGALEPGSGDGNYGSFLARNFPDVRIMGLEANSNLAERLEKTPDIKNYTIDLCKVGHDPIPEHVAGNFNQCFLRFVLQHTNDPTPLLTSVYKSLPVGGKVFVIEEDHAFFTVDEEWTPYSLTTDAWGRVYAAGGSDGAIGRKLPKLFAAAGFTVDEYDVILRNNVEMGDDFLDFFTQAARVWHHTDPELVTRDELEAVTEQFKTARKDHSRQFVATYPQVMLVATKK
jgi:hypothetical protein